MAFGSSPDEPLSCQANPKNTRPNRVKEVCQACVWLMEKSPLSFLKNRDKCFHQLVSGKPIPASRSISQHSFASFAPPLSSSSFFLLFFSSLYPRFARPAKGMNNTCVNVTRTTVEMTREGETGDRSECPFAEGEGDGAKWISGKS